MDEPGIGACVNRCGKQIFRCAACEDGCGCYGNSHHVSIRPKIVELLAGRPTWLSAATLRNHLLAAKRAISKEWPDIDFERPSFIGHVHDKFAVRREPRLHFRESRCQKRLGLRAGFERQDPQVATGGASLFGVKKKTAIAKLKSAGNLYGILISDPMTASR